MTVTNRCLALFSSLTLASVPCASFAQEAADTKALFDSVNQHLDLGGQFYGYLNVKGDFSNLATKAQELYTQAQEMAEGQIPPGIDVTAFLQHLGLDNLDAMGLSSIKFDKGFRNRAFAAVDGERKGLLKLTGGPARPFEIGAFAPTNSLVAMEFDIELSAVEELLTGIGGELEKTMGADPLSQGLEQPIPGTTLNVGQLLTSVKGTLLAYATIDETKNLELPDAPPGIEIPGIDFVVVHKTGKPLYAQIKSFLESEAPAEAFSEDSADGTSTIKILIPERDNLGFYAPIIQIKEDSDHLVIASRPEAMGSLTEGDRLASSSEFARAAALMPKEGNGYSYVSKDVYRFLDIFAEAMQQAGGPKGITSLQTEAMELIYGEPQTIVSVISNTDKGILADGLAPMSYKLSLAYAAILPAAITGAVITPMMQNVRRQAREAR